jgi:hypothetical protein
VLPKAGSAASQARPGGCASSPLLHDSIDGPHRRDVWPVRLKIDPGSNTTGVAIITDTDGNKPAKVLWLFESPFVPAALSQSAMPTESTPSTANFSIARTAMAMPSGPRFLPRLKPGVLSAGGSDDDDKGICSLRGFVAH